MGRAMNGSRIILALDLKDGKRALSMAQMLSDRLFAVKVNWPLVMSAGIGIVKKISSFSRVICDFKLADVPNTVRLITEQARESGAYGIISHSFTGLDSLARVVETAGEMKVFSVVAMSNPGSADFIDAQTDNLISVSKKAGVNGFIAPGNKYNVLRHIRERASGSIILAPGVGKQGGDASTAISNGADYVIIGRAIYEAQDPLGALSEFISQTEVAKQP